MWPAFLIGLLSEWFNDSDDLVGFIFKGFASGVAGVVLNTLLLALFSRYAWNLIGTWTDYNLEFFLMPFVVAFVALIIVKLARYLSNMTPTRKPQQLKRK